ncbi:hypothetical protein CRG98_023616 [Punica granatum]|uniref:Uncharacterized protein n=1 Tax=Punica granatum TaxID=22663 RepID=A0A2I0JIA1_PUNGR|nr:hypothetical protein CRG98_023616 [Punica granatum]
MGRAHRETRVGTRRVVTTSPAERQEKIRHSRYIYVYIHINWGGIVGCAATWPIGLFVGRQRAHVQATFTMESARM